MELREADFAIVAWSLGVTENKEVAGSKIFGKYVEKGCSSGEHMEQ